MLFYQIDSDAYDQYCEWTPEDERDDIAQDFAVALIEADLETTCSNEQVYTAANTATECPDIDLLAAFAAQLWAAEETVL